MNSAANAEVIALLQECVRKLEGQSALPNRPTHTKVSGKPAAAGDVASDTEIDGPHGDPEVRRNPPRWEGRDYAGKRYSQTEPAFLDCLAGFLDWRAGKEDLEPEKAKYAKLSRLDARRARGWARRLRARATTATPAPTAEQGGGFDVDDDIPF